MGGRCRSTLRRSPTPHRPLIRVCRPLAGDRRTSAWARSYSAVRTRAKPPTIEFHMNLVRLVSLLLFTFGIFTFGVLFVLWLRGVGRRWTHQTDHAGVIRAGRRPGRRWCCLVHSAERGARRCVQQRPPYPPHCSPWPLLDVANPRWRIVVSPQSAFLDDPYETCPCDEPGFRASGRHTRMNGPIGAREWRWGRKSVCPRRLRVYNEPAGK